MYLYIKTHTNILILCEKLNCNKTMKLFQGTGTYIYSTECSGLVSCGLHLPCTLCSIRVCFNSFTSKETAQTKITLDYRGRSNEGNTGLMLNMSKSYITNVDVSFVISQKYKRIQECFLQLKVDNMEKANNNKYLSHVDLVLLIIFLQMFNNGNASKLLKDTRATNIAAASAGCKYYTPKIVYIYT